MVADIRHLPFAAGTVDAFRCLHTLEHLWAREIAPTLRHWLDTLKPGGALYLAVPDLGKLAQDYASGVIPFEVFASVAYVPGSRESNVWEKHRWGWDTRTLYLTLDAVGFEQIKPWDGYQPTWTLDFPETASTGLVGSYQVPNLCMEARK